MSAAAPATTASTERSPAAVLPYAATVFLSAFLLFLVQPIVANRILPWFGGSAAVWTTCLVFFQTTLLAGYAYVDLGARLGARRQIAAHLVLLLASLALLPILPGDAWKPDSPEQPIGRILLLLTATIGLPYFLLSTTTPLIQAWYWRRFREAVPYRLFALSNLASLLALLAFPSLLEPWLDLPSLGSGWSILYALFALACAATAWTAWRAGSGEPERQPVPADPAALDAAGRTAARSAGPSDRSGASCAAGPGTRSGAECAADPSTLSGARRAADLGNRPAAGAQLQWVVLSAMGSAMLLAVTNHVTQNVASVPFLWILPLSLYLITFILCFDHPRWYRRRVFVPLLAVALPAMAYKIPSLDLKLAAPLFFAGLFVACMVCHGELVRLKPDPRHLTRFYLMISLGGAIGSILVALVAPAVLPGYFELDIALVALAALLCVRVLASLRARGGAAAEATAAEATVVGATVVGARAAGWLPDAGWPRVALSAAVLALGATAVFAWRGARDYMADLRVMQRDFYGVVRVRDRANPVPYRIMYHGAIMHGGQLLGEANRNRAADYFGPTSGYGRLFAALNQARPGPRRVGVIGLGAGVIAAYGRAGDRITFYEISPRVIDVERREFSYLRDTPAATEVVLGDGRLSLEREAPRRYDVLGIDAFAGDSIPMHLLTREAMAQYVRHLAPDGVIVFQATNRFIDLKPVVRRLASEFGMEAVLVSDTPGPGEGAAHWLSSTDQILVTRDRRLLARPRIAEAAIAIDDRADLPTFTDSHHNLLRILK